MSYKFMSNISDFEDFSNPDKAYISTTINQEINFIDSNNINQQANFLMIRAHSDNDLLVQILPYNYGVFIPGGELWSVDSLSDLQGLIVKKAFSTGTSTSIDNPKIQWMIGYK